MKQLLNKYIGDKKFYKHVFVIILPIMIQQLMLSIAGYVDSLMINSYGGIADSSAYNGVSAANRLMFIMQFIYIGFASTSSIFISQFYGAKNKEKIDQCFSLALIVGLAVGIMGFLVTEFLGDAIVDSFLTSESARYYGYRYLDIMGVGCIITSLGMTVATSYRATKRTLLPMVCGGIGILINITFNYILIFGKFGAPELDALGAGIATIFSRAVELLILFSVIIFSKKPYFKTSYKFHKIDKDLIKPYFKKGIPVVANEIFWSIGVILLVYFSTYQNDVRYNAYSYSQNISDLFFIIFAGLGNGTAIVVGSKLGANNFDEARADAHKMQGLSLIMGFSMGLLMLALSPLILNFFEPTPEVRQMTTRLLIITSVFLTMYAYNASCFFILRAGGDSLRAFILDQGATYFISLPITIILGINASAWGISLPMIFFCSHIADIVKVFIATWFVKIEKWVVNLTKLRHSQELELE